MMNREILKDRILGSMVGGAVGDALGYPIEFNSYKYICRTYGEGGVRRYLIDDEAKIAKVSDDTQMSLFTANGLLVGMTQRESYGEEYPMIYYIEEAYKEWYQTQVGGIDYTQSHLCWIRDIPALNSQRAPGNTCMSALESRMSGKDVNNESKGCGGVMRVAPIGLWAAASKGNLAIDDVVKLGCESARITHQHPLGFLPAGLLVYVVRKMALCEEVTVECFEESIKDGLVCLRRNYGECEDRIAKLERLVKKACELADDGMADVEALSGIGEGWVGEEALAMAIYCVKRHWGNFEEAIISAVNHSGDSDSTGAVVGNLIGAMVGYDAIPECFIKDLELIDTIKELAMDLAEGMCVIESDEAALSDKFRWENLYGSKMMGDKTPIKNSYLACRDLNLFVGEYPGAADKELTVEKLKNFEDFTDFIDLTEEGELRKYEPCLKEEIGYHKFPIKYCNVPENVLDMVDLCKQIVELGASNGKVYLHCWRGIGRTGLVMVCLIAYRMKSDGLNESELYQKALACYKGMYRRYPKSKRYLSPHESVQYDFIKKFVKTISQR